MLLRSSLSSLSILITSVLNSASDRLSISLLLSSFSGLFNLFFHLGHISLSWHTCYVVREGALGSCQGEATHFATLWGRGQRGNNATCWALSLFQLLSPLPASEWCPSRCCPGADSWGEWACVCSRTLWSPQKDSPERLAVYSATATPRKFLQLQVLRHYFPVLEPWVVQSVLSWHCPLPYCSSQFVCTRMWYCLVHQLPHHCMSSPPWLPVSAPPNSLDECFVFNSLVVRLPHSLVFWKFWLFFVFILVIILLLVMRGGEVFLPMPPS